MPAKDDSVMWDSCEERCLGSGCRLLLARGRPGWCAIDSIVRTPLAPSSENKTEPSCEAHSTGVCCCCCGCGCCCGCCCCCVAVQVPISSVRTTWRVCGLKMRTWFWVRQAIKQAAPVVGRRQAAQMRWCEAGGQSNWRTLCSATCGCMTAKHESELACASSTCVPVGDQTS